jgi:hypothetical protein
MALKGLKTVLVNGAVVIGVAILKYVAGLNLADIGLSPENSVLALAVVNFGLRLLTTTPVGQAE